MREWEVGGLLHNLYYFKLILDNHTNWTIHSDNIDKHPSVRTKNRENISFSLCKNTN